MPGKLPDVQTKCLVAIFENCQISKEYNRQILYLFYYTAIIRDGQYLFMSVLVLEPIIKKILITYCNHILEIFFFVSTHILEYFRCLSLPIYFFFIIEEVYINDNGCQMDAKLSLNLYFTHKHLRK